MLSPALIHSAGVIMVSECGESPASPDILTPDGSVTSIDSHQEFSMSEEVGESAADRSVGQNYQFDIAVGRELLVEQMKERSEIDNECDETVSVQSGKEVIPDRSGRYVKIKLILCDLRLVS